MEKYFGAAQDIEWAVDKDLPFPQNILILQTRPETTVSKREAKSVTESGTSGLDYATRLFSSGKK